VLVEAARLQGVGKRDACRVHVDQYGVGVGRFVDLDYFRGSGSVEPGDLYGAHVLAFPGLFGPTGTI
jgi:hypothetical protein